MPHYGATFSQRTIHGQKAYNSLLGHRGSTCDSWLGNFKDKLSRAIRSLCGQDKVKKNSGKNPSITGGYAGGIKPPYNRWLYGRNKVKVKVK